MNRGADLRPTLLAAAVASVLCAPVRAQSQSENELPEVLVTAERMVFVNCAKPTRPTR